MRSGQTFADRFELDRLAGAGGMGAVWRALDRATGEPVALKVMLQPRRELIARFVREARLLLELRHPGIARHVAHGISDDGRYWLAMEWLDGEDLATRIARRPLGIEESLALVEKVVEALGAVHARGVVHRDLKPANLFLPDGDLARVKLLDFGIARLSDATALTDPNAPIGTPAYMAPEQIRGEPDVDARADVYALGCILFECLTGRPAFVAEHVVAVLAKVLLEEAPCPGELRPGVPAEVDALVASLLAKERAARPADAAAVADALRRDGGRGRTGAPGDAPAAALTRSERRLASVVLVTTAEARRRAAVLPPSQRPANEDATLNVGGAPTWPSWLVEARATVQTHGARLDVLRDGMFVIVVMGAGAPTDLATSAARCALAIRALSDEAGVALATGWHIAEGAQPLGQVIDRAAARLAEVTATAHSAVRVDAMTVALLGPRFEVVLTDGGPQLTGERDGLEDARTLLGRPTPCLGRDRELRALEDLFDECVLEPCARAVLVTSPAGMGKSRLRHEFVQRLRARRAPLEVWLADSDPVRTGSPFGLIAQTVRRTVRLVDGAPVEQRRDKVAALVARAVDPSMRARVTEFLGEMVGAPFPDAESVQLRAARQDPMLMGDQMRRAWLDFLDAECRTHPVLLVFEDLHWGDLPSIELVDTALRLLRGRPLMVLALARPELRERFPHPWAERELTQMRLGALSSRACERLVRWALGEHAAADRVDAIVQRAAGHALLLEELVRAAIEGRDPHDAPETALAILQARLEALDADARRILRAASLFGEVFWRGALARLLGHSPDDAALSVRLVELERREWISRQPEPRFQGELEYTFRHGLVREAVYAMLTEADRQLGHRLASGWLEAAGEQDALVLAEHFEQGGEVGDAARCFERAAEQAIEANDLDGAVARVGRALACAPPREAAARLHALAATAHNWRGAFQEAEQAARAASELSQPGSATHHGALAMLAWASGALGKPDQLEAVAAALPLEMRASALRRELFLAWMSACAWLRTLGRHLAAQRVEEAMEAVHLEEVEPVIAGHILTARRAAAVHCGRPESGLRHAEAAASFYERAGDLRQACLSRGHVSDVLLRLGRYAEAEHALLNGLQQAETLGAAYVARNYRLNLAEAHAAQGTVARARSAIVAVLDEARSSSDAWNVALARVTLAMLLLHAGETDEAFQTAAAAAEVEHEHPLFRAAAQAIRAQVFLRRDQAEDALRSASVAIDLVESQGGIEVYDAFVRLTWAEALHASGDVRAAHAALAAARDRLRTEAATIESPELRRSFVENVRENTRIFALAELWGVP